MKFEMIDQQKQMKYLILKYRKHINLTENIYNLILDKLLHLILSNNIRI